MLPKTRSLLVLWLALTVISAHLSAFAQDTAPITEGEFLPESKLYLPLITRGEDTIALAEAQSEDPDTLIASAALPQSMVATTEDYQASGYPDSRKIVRQQVSENLFVGYRKKFNKSYRIFVAKSINGGTTWAATNGGLPIDPATTSNFTQRVPSLAVDDNDTLHMVWYGADNASANECDHQIRYQRSTDGGNTWSNGGSVPRVPGYMPGAAGCTKDSPLWQEHPMIYALNGTILIIWEGRAPCSPLPCTPSSRIKFIKSTNSGDTWSAIQTLPEISGRSFSRPTLVVATRDQQTLYVFAYATSNNIGQIVWIKSNNLGTAWSTGWQFIKNDAQDQRHLSVAMDSVDRLHVVWRQRPSGNTYSRILYARYDTKISPVAWNTQWLPAAKSTNEQFFPTVTVDGTDRVWLAWSEASSDPSKNAYGFPNEDPLVGNIYSATPNTSGGWQKSLYTSSGKALYPVLRYQRYGHRTQIDLVWLAGDGTGSCTNCSIQYARLAGQ